MPCKAGDGVLNRCLDEAGCAEFQRYQLPMYSDGLCQQYWLVDGSHLSLRTAITQQQPPLRCIS